MEVLTEKNLRKLHKSNLYMLISEVYDGSLDPLEMAANDMRNILTEHLARKRRTIRFPAIYLQKAVERSKDPLARRLVQRLREGHNIDVLYEEESCEYIYHKMGIFMDFFGILFEESTTAPPDAVYQINDIESDCYGLPQQITYKEVCQLRQEMIIENQWCIRQEEETEDDIEERRKEEQKKKEEEERMKVVEEDQRKEEEERMKVVEDEQRKEEEERMKEVEEERRKEEQKKKEEEKRKKKEEEERWKEERKKKEEEERWKEERKKKEEEERQKEEQKKVQGKRKCEKARNKNFPSGKITLTTEQLVAIRNKVGIFQKFRIYSYILHIFLILRKSSRWHTGKKKSIGFTTTTRKERKKTVKRLTTQIKMETDSTIKFGTNLERKLRSNLETRSRENLKSTKLGEHLEKNSETTKRNWKMAQEEWKQENGSPWDGGTTPLRSHGY